MTDFSQNPFTKFTAHARTVLARAAEIARSERAPTVTVHHALAAMTKEKGSMAYNLLRLNDVKIRRGPTSVEVQRGSTSGSLEVEPHPGLNLVGSHPAYDPALKTAITKAVATAALHKHAFIGTEHLLSGILSTTDILAAHKRYRKLADQLAHVLAALAQFQKHKHAPSNIFARAGMQANRRAKIPRRQTTRHTGERNAVDGASPQKLDYDFMPTPQKFPALSFFCEELTRAPVKAEAHNAVEQAFAAPDADTRPRAPFFGREREMERLIRTLLRHQKSNPLLVGEAGVGKTALVRGLAERIRRGEAPPELYGKRIFALNLGLLIAGTMFRGEFEARIDDILEEARDRDVILFIDEVHTVIGAGNAGGSLDLAHLLKPALATADIRVVAATTPDEYKKSIARDAALARRFQPIIIREESEEQTRAIIGATKTAYEKHHRVTITPDAIAAAVALAGRYVPNKRFPDKAFDLLDEAAAHLRTATKRSDLERDIAIAERAAAHIAEQKNAAVHAGNYEKGTALREQESAASERLKILRALARADAENRPTLCAAHIRETVADMLGIAPFDMMPGTANDLVSMLSKTIIGQNDALERIAQIVARGKAGLLSKNRPLGSFLLLGPSGVGKTQTAKELARILFGARADDERPDTFIRIDMSEYAEPHTVSRLLGAPPGYVGYEEGGTLAEKVKRNPYALVLFDEIEKAHPQIFNIFLQILDDGMLTDSFGERVSFRNAIIMFTSNIGTEEFNKHALGFTEENPEKRASYETVKTNAVHALREQLRPELLNRIDHIITFLPLAPDALERIAARQLTELARRLAEEKRITLVFTAQDTAALAKQAHNPREGARLVARTVAERVEYPLAQRILDGTLAAGETVHVTDLTDH